MRSPYPFKPWSRAYFSQWDAIAGCIVHHNHFSHDLSHRRILAKRLNASLNTWQRSNHRILTVMDRHDDRKWEGHRGIPSPFGTLKNHHRSVDDYLNHYAKSARYRPSRHFTVVQVSDRHRQLRSLSTPFDKIRRLNEPRPLKKRCVSGCIRQNGNSLTLFF